MELQAVVEPLLDERLETLDMLGREIGPKLDDDAAVFQVEIDGITYPPR